MRHNDLIKKLDKEKDALIGAQVQNGDCPDEKIGQKILMQKNVIDELLNKQKAED